MKKAAFFPSSTDPPQRRVPGPIFELALVIFFVLIVEWAVLPLFGKGSLMGIIPVIGAFAVMLLSHWTRRETPRELGFRIDNFARSFILLLPVMVIATVTLSVLGWVYGSLRLTGLRPDWNLLSVFAGLFLWGLIQQYALQAFINRRTQEIWGKGTATILFTASIFSLLHLPNLWLMIATFLGGLLWAWAYQRVPNLFALGISHAVMTIVLVLTVPYNALHGMRVGYGYFLLQQ